MRVYLEFMRCPVHEGFSCIALSEEGDDACSGGHRLTAGKCCGQWRTVKKFQMDDWELADARDEINRLLRKLRSRARKAPGALKAKRGPAKGTPKGTHRGRGKKNGGRA